MHSVGMRRAAFARVYAGRIECTAPFCRSGGGLGRPDRDRGEGAGDQIRPAVFPWAASGRSLSLGRDEGLTKTLWDEATQRLMGSASSGRTPATSFPKRRWRSRWAARPRTSPSPSSPPDPLQDLRHVRRGLRRRADGLFMRRRSAGDGCCSGERVRGAKERKAERG